MITIVIPTHKPRFLRTTLQSIYDQIGVNHLRTLVIENPTKTAEVSFTCREFPNVEHHICSTIGSNPARNYGINLVETPYVYLMDDDGRLDLHNIINLYSYLNLDNKFGIAGGRVLLEFLNGEPRWLKTVIRLYLSELDWGDSECETYYDHKYLVSANLIFRKSVWEAVGGFDESIGYKGAARIANCEPYFIKKCADYGYPRALYLPKVVIYHQIPKERTTLDYLKSRSYYQGVGEALSVFKENPDKTINDLYTEIFLPNWHGHINQGMLARTREQICHEESTREFIKNLMIMKTEYFRGINDLFDCVANGRDPYEL